MERILSLTNLARLQYVQFFGLAASILHPTGREFFYEKLLSHAPATGEFEKFFDGTYFVNLVSLGVLFVAVSQFETIAAQRKVFQYVSLSYLGIGGVQYAHNALHMHACAAWCFANFFLIVLGVYGLYRHEKIQRGQGTNRWYFLALRITYCAYGIALFVDFLDTNITHRIQANFYKNPTGYRSNIFHSRLGAIFNLIFVMGLIGASQLTDADMKKTIQYSMVRVLLLIPAALEVADLCTPYLRTRFVFIQVLLWFYIHACYPVPAQKTFIRFVYILTLVRAYHCLRYTQHYIETEAPYLRKSTSRENDEVAKICAAYVVIFGLIFVIGGHMESIDQRKFLLYRIVIGVFMLAGFHYYFGVIEPSFVLIIVLSMLVFYYERFGVDKVLDRLKAATQATEKEADSKSPKSKETPSTKKAGRSSTPARKKKD